MSTTAVAACDEVDGWTPSLEEMGARWRTLVASDRRADRLVVPQWLDRLRNMRAEQAGLEEAGHWRGGPRTLLGALDLHYRELVMTGGLAWLVRPDGQHGLGTRFLRALLNHAGVHGVDVAARVRVVPEEPRDDTRADLVVYGDDWTLVIEAKVFAVEQDAQLDRLHDNWSDEPGARFVFLTRGERIPKTCVRSRDAWVSMTWAEVARILTGAAAEQPHVAAGVHEYLATLEAYHCV